MTRARAPKVLVVGAGISGLTCAVRLLEAGFPTRVVAREAPGDTTSAVAAAVWLPYLVGGAGRVERWAERTREVLEELARDPHDDIGSGVVLLEGVELLRRDDADPEWRAALPGFARVPGGFRYRAPLVEMPLHLPYLARRVAALGGAVESGVELASLDEALARADLVVNCAGLGARELAGDATLVGVRGQVLRVAKPADPPRGFVIDDDAPGSAESELTYVLPRSADVVLGGTAEPGREDLALDAAQAERIRARCAAHFPELRDAPLLSAAVGLRPVRPEVRLERDPAEPRLIHDYGHGGSGVTLSWGCAEDVVALVHAGA